MASSLFTAGGTMLFVLSDAYSLGQVARLQRLRPEIELRFAEAFAAAEPDLREWMPSTAREQEDAAAFVDSCVRAFDVGETFAYALVSPADDVIGYINLTPGPAHGVVAYWLHPKWRGRGIASFAVRVLTDAAFAATDGLERLHAHLDAANGGSRRMLEKAGFKHHDSFTRPPRTHSESETEWLYIRERYSRGTRTERLSLRDLRLDDLPSMVSLWTDVDVARFMDDFGPRTHEEVVAWVPEALQASRSVPLFRSWAMELRKTGEVVGWLGFGGDSHGVGDIDFAYVVDRNHRGCGYAAEALRGAISYCFETLGVASFWGQCHVDNRASAAAMRTAGLDHIGTVEGQHRFRKARRS